jgi:hypothetical protein
MRNATTSRKSPGSNATLDRMKGFRSTIPEGISGNWSIESFSVSKRDEEFSRLRSAFAFGCSGRYVPQGTYTALNRSNSIVMSDTPNEIDDLLPLCRRATGRVLISGLGLGCAVELVLGNQDVSGVTVLELSQDVINLVEPTLKARYGDRLNVINADAFTYRLPKAARYNVAWHDIWNDICADNLAEMRKLKRRFDSRCDWQGFWCESECKRGR